MSASSGSGNEKPAQSVAKSTSGDSGTELIGAQTAADISSQDLSTPPEPDDEPQLSPEHSLHRPVFYDAERKRLPFFISGAALALSLFSLGFGALLISLFALRFMPHAPLPKVNYDRDVGNLDPGLKDYLGAKKQFIP